MTFTPETGFQGDPTPIEYVASDADGNLADPATVTVTYPDVPPLSGSGDQGEPVTIPSNLDPGMDPTTVQLINPVTGELTRDPVAVTGEGTWTVDPTTGAITFTPEDGFQGNPTPIEYTAQDKDGNLADPAPVTVTYPDVKDVAGDGSAGDPVTVPVDLGPGVVPSTVQLIDPETGDPIDGPLVVPGEGTWTVDPNTGAITFTPVDGFDGSPTPIEYTAKDGDGNIAEPATVTVSYPDVPDLTGSGEQGEPVTLTPELGTDMDPSTVQLIDPNTGDPIDGPLVVPGEGTWTVDPDTGKITFTPEDGFQGDPTPIEYTAQDLEGDYAEPATVTVTYPDVSDVTGSGTTGTPVTVAPDLEPGMDPTTVHLIDPVTGEPTRDPVVVPGEGTWTVDPNTGEITFTPLPGFKGDPTPIQYTAKDALGNFADPATVTITYTEAAGGPPPSGGQPPSSPGTPGSSGIPGLPGTGNPVGLASLLGGLGLLLGGAWVLLYRRRHME